MMEELTFPVFVKPLHLGSSVGVKKVLDAGSLSDALDEVFKVDTDALVENGLTVREIEFAVYGNDRVETYPPGEILAEGQVFNYDRKYGENATPVRDCADLPHALVEEGMSLAKRAYAAMSCKGMARVDFFLDEKGQYWLNEINPIPGFTSMSLYPRICARHGMDPKALIRHLIILGLERKRSAHRKG
jgi:UDP-N-acetylmuramate--alanine ligase